MDDKLLKELEKFLSEKQPKTEEDLDNIIAEFANIHDSEFENTPYDKAYELLCKAEEAKTPKQAKKFAAQAYEICPECTEAVIILSEFEDNPIKCEEIIADAIEKEKKRLEKEKMFIKENIGIFYGLLGTRAYIKLLHYQIYNYIQEGKMNLAKETALEILRLNTNDNMGARYYLMAIYAYLEDEKSMQELYKKYPEKNLEMLVPFLILYHKKNDIKKVLEYIKKIDEANPNFIKYFKNTMKEDKDIMPGFYKLGDSSEVTMYIETYDFLLYNLSSFDSYILEYYKMLKSKK